MQYCRYGRHWRYEPSRRGTCQFTKTFSSLFVVFAALANCLPGRAATSYYIAANGSDTNNGLSAVAPFQSLAKVSALNLLPGDQILFNRGDTFRGQLSLSRSGTAQRPIVIDGYGAGSSPVLSGTVVINNWTNIGGNLWQASYPGSGSLVTGLYSNGVALRMGRWPALTAANGGFLTADSANGQIQLTSAALAGAPTNNWTGAEVVCRTMQWILDRAAITSQSSNTLNFSFLFPSAYSVQAGWGFFIQNHIATLGRTGDWCFNNTTRMLTLYSTTNPNQWPIEATLTGVVVNLQGAGAISNITLQNLVVAGALQQNIYAHSPTNIVFSNVQVLNAGEDGITIDGSGGAITFTNCVFNHINNDAIIMTGYFPGYAIRGCAFTDIATTAGRGLGGDDQMIVFMQWSGDATPGMPSVIADNLIDGAGYLGFYFTQSNISVRNNVVRNYDLVKDDGGGIYTYNDQYPLPFTNQVIMNNIVYNAIGNTNGVVNYYPGAVGIYLDGHSRNVTVASNTVFNCAGNGLTLNNDLTNAVVVANTLYNNGNQLFGYFRNYNDTVTGNILFCKYPWQTTLKIVNDTADLSTYGFFDTNYFCRPFEDVLTMNFNQNWQAAMDLSLSGWQGLFGKDLHSHASPFAYPSYLTSNSGPNLVSNGTFDSSINGWGVYAGFVNNVNAVWDNPGTLDGGCLKLSFGAPSGNLFNTLNAFDYQDVFAVNKGTVYQLSFDAVGAAQNRVLRTYLLQNNSPWDTVTAPAIGVVVGTNRAHYSVFLTAKESVSASRPQWQLNEPCDQPTVWIDNIRLSTVSAAPVNPDNVIRFEYNAASTPKVVALDASYQDVTTKRYSGNVTLPPFSSLVLLKSDPPVALSIARQSPNTISLVWSGLPGSTCQVQTSTNLHDWSLLGSFSARADGSFSVLDTNAIAQARFYRTAQ
jgi:hypothetical protein